MHVQQVKLPSLATSGKFCSLFACRHALDSLWQCSLSVAVQSVAAAVACRQWGSGVLAGVHTRVWGGELPVGHGLCAPLYLASSTRVDLEYGCSCSVGGLSVQPPYRGCTCSAAHVIVRLYVRYSASYRTSSSDRTSRQESRCVSRKESTFKNHEVFFPTIEIRAPVQSHAHHSTMPADHVHSGMQVRK